MGQRGERRHKGSSLEPLKACLGPRFLKFYRSWCPKEVSHTLDHGLFFDPRFTLPLYSRHIHTHTYTELTLTGYAHIQHRYTHAHMGNMNTKRTPGDTENACARTRTRASKRQAYQTHTHERRTRIQKPHRCVHKSYLWTQTLPPQVGQGDSTYH